MRIHAGITVFSQRKICQPVSLLNKLQCSYVNSLPKNATCQPDNPNFINPARKCNAAPPKIKSPIRIKLPAKNCYGQGRVYDGDYPSVTTILDATRTKSNLFALLNWRRKQITDLGLEEFNEKVAHTKYNGTTFHQAIKAYFSNGDQPKLADPNQGHWQSIAHVLPNITKVFALESVVVHHHLKYAGTMDGLFLYKDKLCLIDWKTSSKKRTMLKDCFSYPHQIVAYAGAVNHDPNYVPLQVCNGLLVLAYADGSPADALWMSSDICQRYWREWLERLRVYYNNLDSTNHSNVKSIEQNGKQLTDLPQYVGGARNMVKVIDNSIEESGGKVPCNVNGLDYGAFCSTTSEFYESPIDVFGTDPSLAEFSDDLK